MELEFEAEQGVESVSRFHDVGHHLQHVVEHGALPLFVAFAAHAGKWRRGQAHESHFAFVAQPFGHAGDEEFHDAVDAVGTVTHEVERPSDHFAVLIGRQPAGDAQHLTVRVHRVQQFDAWIDQLVHATQGEAHFRQGLLAGPLRGDLTDLRLHGERGFLECGEHVGDAVALGFVDGGAHVLPFLAARLPCGRVDHHFGADVERVPAGGDQRVTLFGVHAVEHRRQGTLGAEAGERMQIVLILVWVAERSGDGQCDAVRHAVGDGGTAGGGEPVIVAFPSGHERHGFAAESDDLVHAVTVRVVDHGTVTQATPCAAQRDQPKHRSDALVDDFGKQSDRHERRFHAT